MPAAILNTFLNGAFLIDALPQLLPRLEMG